MNKEELLQKVEDVIVDTFEIDRAIVKPEADLVADLDFDSLDAIELILQLEEQYDAKISAEKLKSQKLCRMLWTICMNCWWNKMSQKLQKKQAERRLD